MPTNLPQPGPSFVSEFLCACILVPMIYGIVAYGVIAHEKLVRASGNAPMLLSTMSVPDVRR